MWLQLLRVQSGMSADEIGIFHKTVLLLQNYINSGKQFNYSIVRFHGVDKIKVILYKDFSS